MLDLNDQRLNAGYRLPDPVHPDSLVAAVEEVAARYPYACTTSEIKGNLVARVAVELGCSWFEVGNAEDLTTDLNDVHTPGAPLRLLGERQLHVTPGLLWAVGAHDRPQHGPAGFE